MAKKSAALAPEGGIRISEHPRARRHIALAKGWGGLGAFVVVLLLSQRAGLPTPDAILRSLLGGVIGYVVAWMIAVTVWRHLALAELERLRRRLVVATEHEAQVRAQAPPAEAPPTAR